MTLRKIPYPNINEYSTLRVTCDALITVEVGGIVLLTY